MKLLLILVVFCAFTAAMVPRERRAVNDEELPPSTTKPICAAQTPCGWVFYKQHTKRIDSHVDNTYCQCDATTICMIDEDDTSAQSYIKKCKPPNSEPFNIDS